MFRVLPKVFGQDHVARCRCIARQGGISVKDLLRRAAQTTDGTVRIHLLVPNVILLATTVIVIIIVITASARASRGDTLLHRSFVFTGAELKL